MAELEIPSRAIACLWERGHVKSEFAEYIGWYNTQRGHTSLNSDQTPDTAIKQHSVCNFAKFLSLRGVDVVDKSLVFGLTISV